MATIRCGECKGTHGSVQEVRDCHDDGPEETQEEHDALMAAERINSQSFCGELRGPTYEDYLERELEAWTET